MSDYRRILIIKPGAIGDLLQLSPVLRLLRDRYPHAVVTLMVGNSASIDLFRYNPFVDNIVVFDKRGEHRTWSKVISLWKLLRAGQFDLVINFQRSNLKAWFLASAAFPCQVLTYHKTRKKKVHAVLNHLQTVFPLGIKPDDMHLDFYLSTAEVDYATETMGKHVGPAVAINPGASNRIKCWSTRQLAALADRLTNDLGARIVIVGGPDERDLAEDICSKMRTKPVDLVGRTNLLQLGAILKHCDVAVSGDTGPMHMATAVGTPVVALFGAIDPDRTGPMGSGHEVIIHKEIACVPCNARKCNNKIFLECMETISVEEVFRAVANKLREVK